MESRTSPVISGIVVLVAGLIALFVVAGGVSEAPAADAGETAAAVTSVSDPNLVVEGTTATTSLSDLDPAVERVLLGSGDAWVYRADAGLGLPAEVARVLDAYQVPLMIPKGEGR